LQSFDAELALRPDEADTWQHRANALQELRRFDEALASYDRVLALEPDHVGAWLNRGNICGRLGRRDQALSAFDRALDLHPGLAGAWLGRANIRCSMGRIDEALADYEKALAFDPRLAAAWVGRGNALSVGKRHREALAAYDKAIALDFGLADAWLGRGNALTELGRYDEALARYDRAIELRPDLAAAWLGRGNVLRQKRSHHEALAAYDEALRLDPNLAAAESVRLQAKMAVCNWDHFEADRDRLTALLRQGHILRPFDLLSISPEPEDQYRCARLFSESNWPQAGGKVVKRAAGRGAHPPRLHVRRFSPAPVTYLMVDIFDRSGFEVSAISIGPDDASPMRQRLRTSFDRFVEARSLTDAQIAKLLEEAGVDILVDLMGFTKGARGGVIARRPAPIQVNYLGYPGTTGMTQIDYIIADHVVIPHHTRVLLREGRLSAVHL
jgi:protein O-GlcNAc transferase